MIKEEIATLNKKRELLHKDYRKVVIEWTKFNDEYKAKMAGIGDQIHEIDMEIRRLRTPIEIEN